MRFNFRACGAGLIGAGVFQAILNAGLEAWGPAVIQLGFVGLGLLLRMDRKFLRNLVV